MNGNGKVIKVRMTWNESAQKWLMQKYNKISNEWVFIYDFWDCGNVKTLFNLFNSSNKKFPQHYEITITKKILSKLADDVVIGGSSVVISTFITSIFITKKSQLPAYES